MRIDLHHRIRQMRPIPAGHPGAMPEVDRFRPFPVQKFPHQPLPMTRDFPNPLTHDPRQSRTRVSTPPLACAHTAPPPMTRMDETVIQTPYYLIDQVKAADQHGKDRPSCGEASGAKALLALKCFATWGVFDFMADYMDGTTSSSLNEVRLGREKFGKETHAYSVAYADHEIDESGFPRRQDHLQFHRAN